MNYCFITAYLDISRDKWSHFVRTNDDYLKYFKLLCMMKIPLVVFIDKKHSDKVFDICKDRDSMTKIIQIDRDFLSKNIKSWSYVETENKIMKSQLYKKLTNHRSHCPETKYSEYTCINHSKIDFVKYVIDNKIIECDYYGWVDFGYVRDEKTLTLDLTFNPSVWMNDKVNMIYNSIPDEKDRDPFYTLVYAPERITGPFWFGRKDKLLEYNKLYHDCLQKLHSLGIADDDQHVMVQSYFNSNIIMIHHNKLLATYGWFTGFLLYN